jgi:hypothetical protein
MSITRRNKIIEYVIQMPVGATAPITDPTAIPILHEANNTKTLAKCLKITSTTIEKLYATELEYTLARLLR